MPSGVNNKTGDTATAVFHMENGGVVAVRLLREFAPNTVDSFIHCVRQGVYEGHAIERIVPGKYVDLSYKAFSRPAAKYLIPLEYALHPELRPMEIDLGCACIGGYSSLGIAGGEVFFPICPCPELYGQYPVFGEVIEGLQELRRIASVPVAQVFDVSGVTVYKPLNPEIIRTVTLELGSCFAYREPVKLESATLPDNWRI